MDLFANPLLLAIVSAAISALITAAIETAITNRQKNALERQLEGVRHKHTLEIEQLRLANSVQLEEIASERRLEHERNRDAVEQRLVRWPKAIAAAYKLRYGFLELLTSLDSQQTVTREQLRDYADTIANASQDLYQVDDPAFRELAWRLVFLCSPGPSAGSLMLTDVQYASEQGGEKLEREVARMREQYNKIKEIQSSMLGSVDIWKVSDRIAA